MSILKLFELYFQIFCLVNLGHMVLYQRITSHRLNCFQMQSHCNVNLKQNDFIEADYEDICVSVHILLTQKIYTIIVIKLKQGKEMYRTSDSSNRSRQAWGKILLQVFMNFSDFLQCWKLKHALVRTR